MSNNPNKITLNVVVNGQPVPVEENVNSPLHRHPKGDSPLLTCRHALVAVRWPSFRRPSGRLAARSVRRLRRYHEQQRLRAV